MLYQGDVRAILPTLPTESVDCCMTSPPFYGLRDYGVAGQIGLEASPDEWVAELVAVFAEVRRLLKPQGTLWVECGDSYAAGKAGRSDEATIRAIDAASGRRSNALAYPANDAGGVIPRTPPDGTKPKDLLGSPWLLAFALRADGWYLRQAIIWHKPNAMPESVRDRCTTAHSYVFLLSKQPRYWFDAEAIAEPAEWARWGDQTTPKYEGTETASGWIQPKSKRELVNVSRYSGNQSRQRDSEIRAFDARADRADGRKNARSIWSIPTSGYSEAHFATFPEALVERMLKAGCPEWVCVKCGKARERVTVDEFIQRQKNYGKWRGNDAGTTKPPSGNTLRETVGWSDCGCGAGVTPGTVLDPFMGSGTTALVARRLGRRALGVELSADYCAMAAERTQQLSWLAEAVEA
jgi:DNA modification methylase